jgi:hypothetical protein
VDESGRKVGERGARGRAESNVDSKKLLFELSSVVGVLCRCIWLRLSYALGVDVNWSRQRETLSWKGGRQVYLPRVSRG